MYKESEGTVIPGAVDAHQTKKKISFTNYFVFALN